MKTRMHPWLAGLLAAALPLTPVSAQNSGDVEAEGALEEVLVTAIRRSLLEAQDIKQQARNIVEAITPEDLGKFVDDSIAESLQRLPGVQVEEDYVGSRGDQVSIRGLGPQFVVATINGRTAWSSGSGEGFHLRSYNFSVIPSEIVNEVLVTKTPLADTVETGIGGAVDVRTLRPLSADYGDKNWLGRFDARAEMADIGDKDWGPRLSGIFSAKNDAETIGGYVAANWSKVDGGRDTQQVRYRTNRDFYVDNNDNWVRDDDEFYKDQTTIRDVLYRPDRWELERSGIAAALEFRPNDEWTILADVVYTEFNRENHRPNTRFDVDSPFRESASRDDNLFAPGAIMLNDGGIGDSIIHNTFIDINGARCTEDGVQIESADCVRRAGRALSMRDQIRNNFTDTLVGGLNVAFDRGNWHVNGDLFWNDLDAVVLEASMDANNSNFDNPFIVDIQGGGRPFVNAMESDLDLNRYSPRRLRIRQRTTQGDQVGARLDFDVEMEQENIESIQFGVRYNTSDIAYTASQRASWDDGGADEDAFFNAFYSDQYWDPVDGVALPAVNFRDSFEYLSAVGLDGEVDPGFGPCTTGNVDEFMFFTGRFDPKLTRTCADLLQSFSVKEDTYNAYGAINLIGNWGSVPVFANLGVRYVKTENSSTGVVAIEINEDTDESPEPDPNDTVTTKGSFSEFLPTLNMGFELTERLQLRFAAAKTLSRPEVYDISSRFKISVNDDDDSGDITPEDCEGGGNCIIKRGNPNLDPYTAWNYDLTLMWAMPNDGFLAASVFYKDIEGFIFDAVSGPVTLPGYGDIPFLVEQPENAEDAKVKGFEIAYHQPFTFFPAPWDGFGIQLNYSYVDSEFTAGTEAYDSGTFGLPGASPNNFNGILYFETRRFGARLSYVYRDDYFSSFGGGAFSNVDRYVQANENLSLNLSFNVTDSIELIAKATNLTDDVQREFITYETLTQSYYTRPRTYSLGARFKF